LPNIATNDKAKNIIRNVVRVVEQLSRTSEIDTIPRFSEFLQQ